MATPPLAAALDAPDLARADAEAAQRRAAEARVAAMAATIERLRSS